MILILGKVDTRRTIQSVTLRCRQSRAHERLEVTFVESEMPADGISAAISKQDFGTPAGSSGAKLNYVRAIYNCAPIVGRSEWGPTGPIVATAREYPHLIAVAPADEPEAVMLDLVHPLRPGQDYVGGRGKARARVTLPASVY
jgi:hypothetical protein